MEPSRDWKEIVPVGEAAKLEGYAEQLRELQRARAKGKPPHRALHAKGQAPAEAELTVLADLPEHARVGLFKEPRTFRALARFSNGAGVRQADSKGDVRGLAIKVLGVPGPKIIPGLEKATTQDFLFIQSPVTPFRNADEFVWFVVAAARPATLLPKAIARFGPGRALGLLRQLVKGVSRPVVSLATSHYYSALPIAFGPYAVKYALVPHGRAATDATPGKSPDYLTLELAARLAKGPVVYDFAIQFFVDEQRTPIEDSSVEWKTHDAPFVTVARLTLPQQDLGSSHGREVAERVEKMSFDPWHATADFRPLGNMMRARSAAYRLSVIERGASPEPGIDTPPGDGA
jgi:hypothetical protein